MKNQDPMHFLNQLEEYYNPQSPSYKFSLHTETQTLNGTQISSTPTVINGKAELLQKHMNQKQMILHYNSAIKELQVRKERIKMVKREIEAKLRKLVTLKRHVVSDCRDVSFVREKINTREPVVLNDQYVSVLQDVNSLLLELREKVKGKK